MRRTASARLKEYEAKRDFAVTPEPPPAAVEPSPVPTFMVHKHHASRLHYDLRLEMDGVLASWAVPKGPSFDPGIKRLAVQTEDHPLEYGGFEGRIPDGEYGGGDSLIWDRGTYDTVPPGQASAQRKKGHLHLELCGEKLKGRWHLVRTAGGGGGKPGWILFKANDETADPSFDVVTARPESVASGKVATRGPERASVLRAIHPAPDRLVEKVLGGRPPMLATLVDAPPAAPPAGPAAGGAAGPAPGRPAAPWVFEAKYDGFRMIAGVSGGRVALRSRNGLDLTGRFPSVVRALARLVVGEAVLDGEAVAVDEAGAPRFQLLQNEGQGTEALYAFDLLWLDGEDLRGRPLEERRDLLESLLAHADPPVHLAERLAGTAEEALGRATALGFEGIIAKARGSRYEGGRSRVWLKVKSQRRQELAVVGFTPSKATERQIGALLLGVVEDGRLRYAGKVGTGFTHRQRAELWKTLAKDAVPRPAIAGAPRMKAATWVEPRLVAEVEFTEWTADGKLRHPAFLGLRPDKTPPECVLEVPERAPAPPGRGSAERGPGAPPSADPAPARAPAKEPPAPLVRLTSPDKLMYPDAGITKRDVAAYYLEVAGPMIAALADRPLALEHWPKGVGAPSWYQQNIGAEAKPWMSLVETPTRTSRRTVRHLVADRPETLLWLAQHSVLAVHMWSARGASLESPDWVIFDLDPADGEGIEQAIRAALVLRALFEEIGLPSLPKTTGKRGLHVLVPLAPGHTHEDAVAFAERIAEAVARAHPDMTTVRARAERRGRLYLDYLQNGYGKTIVAPYSLRGVPGAPVSTPLDWSEVRPGLDPRAFNLRTLPARLEARGDLFAEVRRAGVRLPTLR